ncbi:hypothetical protein COX03_03150 [Candidatus Woesebacteria bacterium CG22_combo_CG10-13_8_21_14_all_39_10]|uniref:DUF86 domain-containing protein n=1 Tax=Candidatus Woesebacteria bacterium CG22_combo_CG10-13_8_21_14_all_39_10 TaxID=1975059 RepID=A0A2H0BIG4_9BACT|nr:MAG: hypothetical protein COX03_03150 [Candidatus Woesebacteria bacterium CG22_combo_CG10-13_8_21_14_all_39_10]
MLDKEFVVRKVKLIQEELSKLEALKGFSFDEVARDGVKMAAVERYLEKVVMRAIDINQHVISELGKGNEPLKGYEDTFYALAKIGVYDEAFAKEIAPSAGLRNRLVHEYNSTKEEIVYDSVTDALKDYSKYCDFVLKFIEKN